MSSSGISLGPSTDTEHHLAFHHKSYRLGQPPHPPQVGAEGQALPHQQARAILTCRLQDELPGGDGKPFLFLLVVIHGWPVCGSALIKTSARFGSMAATAKHG